MKIKHHAVVSTIVSGILYSVFKSWGLAIASFVSGIFVDLDHIIDFLIAKGLRFHPEQFFNYFNEKNFGSRDRLFFLFHAWEWLILIAVAAWLTGWNFWITGLLIGYGHHMLLDELYNSSRYRIRPWILGYFILWRWKKGFRFR